jgi:DMSO/TMAO reductase YedYZ molybdopterin-dependent catalytic subunit
MDLKDRLKDRKSLIVKAALLLVIIGVAAFAAVWLSGSFVHQLRPDEIHEYMGQNLSLIDDFRENSIKGPQQVNISSYELALTGLVDTPRNFTYSDVINGHANYQKVVTLHCVEGWDVTILWEGVLVKDLLDEAGINTSAKVVIFYAYDGYSTSLPFSFIIDNQILLAYKMNGLVLPPERGFPFQLVAESKYGYKWIKWVTGIELPSDENYQGYWESRGFSNDATVP